MTEPEKTMEEMLVERVSILEEKDGTRIGMTRYRAHNLAPWIEGMYEVHCGSCGEQVAEVADLTEARLRHVEHQLDDVRKELSDYRMVFHNLGQSRGSRAK